jgi:hypothetical protein
MKRISHNFVYVVIVLIVCMGIFYGYQYTQEGYGGRKRYGGGGGGGGRGSRGRGGRGSRGSRGRHGGGGGGRYPHYPRRQHYPNRRFYNDYYYDTPDVNVYPIYGYPQNTTVVTNNSFTDYLRWLFGYPPLQY